MSKMFPIPLVFPWLIPLWDGEDLLSLGILQQEFQVFLFFDNANSFTAHLPPLLLW